MEAFRFANDHIAFQVVPQGTRQLFLTGQVKNAGDYEWMQIVAPAPIDRRTAYHGSGLPFPCPDHALGNTPNRIFPQRNGQFQGVFEYPNSYYTYDAVTKIKPSIFAVLVPRDTHEPIYMRFELPEEDILYVRSLTHRPERRTDALFYHSKDLLIDPIPETSEKVMLALKDHKERGRAAV